MDTGVTRSAEKRSIGVIAIVIVLLHIVGFGMLALAATGHFQMADGEMFGIGLGITAYTLGMRHAFDADHIAAIDNATRNMVAAGRRPTTTGFWFSLGHSTVVLVLCVLLTVGVKTLASQVSDDASTLQKTTGTIGTSVSGLFLLILGVLNLVVLVRIIRSRRSAATTDAAEAGPIGPISRLVAPVLRSVRAPWQLYPVGLLFGLGFDTATEISLLVLAGAAAVHLPWYAVLSLPILFTAGMSLFDSIDGVAMHYAYGWAHEQPQRRVFYNIVVTTLSVIVALLIGGIELIGLLADKLGITSGPLAWIGGIGLDHVGYIVVGLFAVTWAVALVGWRISSNREVAEVQV
nr:HoxN/HupN/NixA family nickel/cobalt transporter [Jongsikchunia kroppenstedtii]